MSPHRTMWVVTLLLVMGIGGLPSTAYGSAPSHPWLRVAPARAPIGKTVILTGGRFQHGKFYTLLFAVPNMSRPHARSLLGVARADSRGNLRVAVRLPVVTKCGAAKLYVFLPQLKVAAQASFHLIGCKASSSLPPLPPPPTSKTHKKKP